VVLQHLHGLAVGGDDNDEPALCTQLRRTASHMTTMVLLGPDGHDAQVGWELRRALASLGEALNLPRQMHRAVRGTLCGDLARPEAVAETLLRLKPRTPSMPPPPLLWTRPKPNRKPPTPSTPTPRLRWPRPCRRWADS